MAGVTMPDETPRGRLALWVAHRAIWWWGLAPVLLVVSAVIPGQWPNRVANAVLSVSLTGVWIAERRHDRVMCPQCAADVPMDAQAETARRARTLRWAHRMQTWWVGLGVNALMIVTIVFPLRVGKIPNVLFLTLFLFIVAETHVASVHRPLMPWCPQCHWDDDGGDDDEFEPAPVPPEDHAAVPS